jgi:hypothetical protein
VDDEKMKSEDFRSRAYENIEKIFDLNRTIGRLQEVIVEKDHMIVCKERTIVDRCEEIE